MVRATTVPEPSSLAPAPVGHVRRRCFLCGCRAMMFMDMDQHWRRYLCLGHLGMRSKGAGSFA